MHFCLKSRRIIVFLMNYLINANIYIYGESFTHKLLHTYIDILVIWSSMQSMTSHTTTYLYTYSVQYDLIIGAIEANNMIRRDTYILI